MTDMQPETLRSIPKIVLFYSVISFHLAKLAETTQCQEAIFHWRQIRYYRDEWRSILDPSIVWLSEKEFVQTMVDDGQCRHIVEAIMHFNLLEVPKI